jgi:hypothetical protein
MVRAGDATSVTLKLADETYLKLEKADIAKQESAPSSMPDIYSQILSKSDLRDLMEYLASLRTSGRGGAATGPIGQLPAPPPSAPRALRGLPATQ